MTLAEQIALLTSLLAARTRDDILTLLASLGDTQQQGLEQPFGPFNLRWRAFGDNPSNNSTIGLGTKPGKSLTERVTNAIDALLEERARSMAGIAMPRSPRLAAEEWFGRAVSGPDQGLFRGMAVQTDRRISVVLLEGGDEHAPTVDVLDDGVGLAPEELPTTILSLQAGNKIRKLYQIGAFGQGGAASLGFADYVVVVSRRFDEPERVAFTLIRVLRLDASYKEDCYAYLTIGSADGGTEIFCGFHEGPLVLYQDTAGPKITPFAHGTLVRHIRYRLNGINKSLAPSPGNLYHYLHYSVFDPILPFRVVDLRSAAKARNELVTGGRNRLMRLATEKAATEDDAEARVQVRHYRPMEYVTPAGESEPCIGVEYWVVLAYRKKEGKLELRGNSAELFVQPNYPILGTLNGQTQGELGGHLLREFGLTLLSKHMVIHIDASDADSQVRRQLFSSSREGFKEGPILDGLVNSIRRMVEDDQTLFEIEQELTDRLTKRETAETREEVRLQVSRLLKEAGFKVSERAQSDTEDLSGEARLAPKLRTYRAIHTDPLPTLLFPQVTRFDIVYPEDLLQIHSNDSGLIIVETDADQEYDVRGLIHIRTDPPVLEVETKARLRGGRIRWRLRAKAEAQVGTFGELIVSLTRLDGSQLTSSCAFEILPAREVTAKQASGQVPPFEIRPISPEKDSEIWEAVWPNDMGETGAQASHAYKVLLIGGKTVVFYSTFFQSYADTIEKLKAKNTGLIDLFTVQYEVWIAYHAILQFSHAKAVSAPAQEDENFERYFDQERALVAQMQIKQALTVAELMRRVMTVSA